MNQCPDCKSFKKADNCIRCATEAKANQKLADELWKASDKSRFAMLGLYDSLMSKYHRFLIDIQHTVDTVGFARIKKAVRDRLEQERSA